MEDKLLIVEYFLDYGRMGELNGLFICTETEYNQSIGRKVYWGEVLGKHSEVYHTLEADDLLIKSDDQEFITKLREVLGVTWNISGFNPIARIQERDDDGCEDDEDE